MSEFGYLLLGCALLAALLLFNNAMLSRMLHRRTKALCDAEAARAPIEWFVTTDPFADPATIRANKLGGKIAAPDGSADVVCSGSGAVWMVALQGDTVLIRKALDVSVAAGTCISISAWTTKERQGE